MALLGMPSYSADEGSWTIAMPSSALIALSPRVPSVPFPERMIPIAVSLWSSAKERKKVSIGSLRPLGSFGFFNSKHAMHDDHFLIGRKHMDAIALDLHAVFGLQDGHFCVFF